MSLDYVLSALCDAVIQKPITEDAIYLQSSSCECRAELSQDNELIFIVCAPDVDRFVRLLLLGILHEEDHEPKRD